MVHCIVFFLDLGRYFEKIPLAGIVSEISF